MFLDTTVLDKPLPLYIGFPVIALASALITITVSLLTSPTDIEVLKNFYRKVQPAGAWAPARSAILVEDPDFKKQSPFTQDAMNTVIALVAICCLYISTSVPYFASAGTSDLAYSRWSRSAALLVFHLVQKSAASEGCR